MTDLIEPPVDDRDTVLAPSSGMGWRRLLLVAGSAATAAMALAALFLGDLEAAAVAAGFGLATWAGRRGSGILGAGGVALLSAVTLAFMAAAAVTNVRAGSGAGAVLLSSGLAALSLTALGGAVGFLVRGDTGPSLGAWAVLGLAATGFLGLLAWSGVSGPTAPARTGVELTAADLAFSESALTALPGEVTVLLANEDLFWHTFTIDELGVDLQVPVAAELAVTFDAPPGDYDFYCAIPGHLQAGMTGVLTIGG